MSRPSPLRSPASRREDLETALGTWTPRTIAQALDVAVEKYSDRPLVISDERVWSYADVKEASQRLALRLVAHGVKPHDHVGLYLANQPEFAIAKFAIARVGAVAIPINYLLREYELSYVLQQSECVALIAMDTFRGRDYLGEFDRTMTGWEGSGGGDSFPKLKTVFVLPCQGNTRPRAKLLIDPTESPSSADLASLRQLENASDPHFRSDVIYTSGTTGRPKGVVITHDMVLRTAYASAYTRAFEDGRRILFALPMYHVFGYVECLMACLFVGGAVVPRLAFDPEDMLSSAEQHEVDEIVCVPLMTLKLLDLARKRGFACPSLTAFFNSGGVSPLSIWQEIIDVFGASELLTGYGMTETTASTCCTLPEGDPKHLLTSNGRLKDAGIAGVAELGGKLAIYKVVDPETGRDLPVGDNGELLVRGPAVTSGYYNKPEENALAFTEEGWLHTGDIGSIDADGYVALHGRIKESYRCGGEMVMPHEIEEVLMQHPKVEEAYLVGVPDAKMGEVGCAFIVPRGSPPDEAELIQFCADRLARFKVPKYILLAVPADIPQTATGRAQRVYLSSVATQRLGLRSPS